MCPIHHGISVVLHALEPVLSILLLLNFWQVNHNIANLMTHCEEIEQQSTILPSVVPELQANMVLDSTATITMTISTDCYVIRASTHKYADDIMPQTTG